MGLLRFFKRLFGLRSGNDKALRCMDCGKEFIFEEGEQEFFRQKGFQEPKRCPRCRKQHRGGRFHKR